MSIKSSTLKLFVVLSSLLMGAQTRAQDDLFAQHNCTFVYSLDGKPYEYFNNQVDRLKTHIRRNDIVLIDLNNWKHDAPHVPLSGRQKSQLRTKLGLSYNIREAVLVSKKGQLIAHLKGSFDMVEVIMLCEQFRLQ